jgi:hypothetical protein
MRIVHTALATAVALALAACGASQTSLVRGKVEQFAKATASRDYRTICDQVLAPSLLLHLTSNRIDCQQALTVALGAVRDPTLTVAGVTVTGSRAAVIAFTGAAGQPSSLSTIELTKTSAGWRIDSLGSSPGAR